MQHGNTARVPDRARGLEARLVELTQEYFRADPARKAEIAAEFDALQSGALPYLFR